MIKKITREGDTFVMTVQLGGTREDWTYVREEVSGRVSFILVGRA
jgi:hypothetical protein